MANNQSKMADSRPILSIDDIVLLARSPDIKKRKRTDVILDDDEAELICIPRSTYTIDVSFVPDIPSDVDNSDSEIDEDYDYEDVSEASYKD